MSNFPVERPGSWETLGDHERRIRALEALRPCCGDSSGACLTWGECVLARTSIEFYWPCDEPSGNLIDRVQGLELEPVTEAGFPSYGNSGPLDDLAVGFGGIAGLSGNEGRFQVPTTDGSPSILDIIGGSNPFTIESWVYSSAISDVSNNRIVHCWSGSGGTEGLLLVDGGSIEDAYVSAVRDTTGIGDSVSSAYPLNTWTFWRLTFDGSDMNLYLDDTLVDTAAAPGVLDNLGANFVIGNNEGSFWTPLNGRIAHLAIYSDVVTAFCDQNCIDGNALEFQVLTADGQGGTYWDYPTIEVEY